MCGVFGLIRLGNPVPGAIERGTDVFIRLGIKAEERGTDAAGIAALKASPTSSVFVQPTAEQVASPLVTIDEAVILKSTGRFTDLGLADYPHLLHPSSILIGHTRAASQGAADDIRNASPLLAGALIGTHNGDIDTQSLANADQWDSEALSDTDSARLYQALNAARTDRRDIVSVLRSVRGRGALVFIDRSRTDRLYLARTALSPLAFARTGDGDFVWASNPDWFRQVQEETLGAVTFSDITLVPEGTLITLDTLTGEIADTRSFTPTCRQRDLHLLNSVVYKRFLYEDKAAFIDMHRHRVASAALPKWPGLVPAPVLPRRKSLLDSIINPEVSEIELVDFDEVEELCMATGTFDQQAFDEIFECEDDAQASRRLHALREHVAHLISEGKAAPGYRMPSDGSTAA